MHGDQLLNQIDDFNLGNETSLTQNNEGPQNQFEQFEGIDYYDGN